MPKVATAVVLAALAAPALATTAYVPFADRLQSGAPQHRTELRLTNGQSSQAQSLSYRVFVDGRATAAQAIRLAPGQSRTLSPAVPAGASGLIEIDVPTGISLRPRLLVQRSGNAPSVLSMPAFVAESAAPAGARIVIDGIALGGGRRTALSVQNLDNPSATCTIGWVDDNGNALGPVSEFRLAGKSARQQEDALARLAAGAVADGHARISCNRRFWAYALVEEEATGNTALVTPAMEISPSATAVTEALAPCPTGSTCFFLPGNFLTCSNLNLGWVYKLYLGGKKTFRKAIVDHDFFVNKWDPYKPTGYHELLWFQKGAKWNYDMMSYINAKGSSGKMRFEANYNYFLRRTHTPGLSTQRTYHLHWEWDGFKNSNWYQVLLGTTVVTKSTTFAGAGSWTTNGTPFLGVGGQPSSGPNAPEARQPGWKYYDLRVELVP